MAERFETFNIVPPNEIYVVDIEEKIEDLFMSALKAVFKHDKRYPYLDDAANSKVIITTDFPTKESAPEKKPHIMLSNIQFSVNMNTAAYRNFENYSASSGAYLDNKKYSNFVPYSLLITVAANKSTSRVIANIIINYIATVYRTFFDGIGLNIANIAKNPTQASSRSPEKIFETMISVNGHVEWTSVVHTIDITKENVLNHIKLNLETK